MVLDPSISSRFVDTGCGRIHYLTAGQGAPVLLLHGWPTSSLLWREVMPRLAPLGRILAPDLPGFGETERRPSASYSLDPQAKAVDAFLGALGIERLALVLHDLGGPIGLLWAVRNAGRVERLAVLNTLLYPDGASRLFFPDGSLARRLGRVLVARGASPALRAMLLAVHTPYLRRVMFSGPGVGLSMRLGVAEGRLSRELLDAYRRPFASAEGRRALERTLLDPRLEELEEIVRGLPGLRVPACIVYGAKDPLLPGGAEELHRLSRDLGGAPVQRLDSCGHFLQEDRPEELAAALAAFLRRDASAACSGS